jgi:hypothetical protein
MEIPSRLRLRPQYQGYIIPYTTFIHPVTRVPDFKINDERQRHRCILYRRCAMCGEKMKKLIRFIGGEDLCTEPRRLAVDAGMHPECGRYAWNVWPYSVHGRGHAAYWLEIPGAVMETFREIPTEPVEAIYMITTDSYKPVRWNGNLFGKPSKALAVQARRFDAPAE